MAVLEFTMLVQYINLMNNRAKSIHSVLLNENLLFLTLNEDLRSVKIKKTYSPNQNVFSEVSPFVLKNLT